MSGGQFELFETNFVSFMTRIDIVANVTELNVAQTNFN